MSDRYTLSVKQVAELFGVSRQAVYKNWIRKGIFSIEETPEGIRFNDAQVYKWVDELRGYTLKTADVMKLAGVTSGQAVFNWVLVKRTLPSRKHPSGEFRFKPSEVERLLALRRQMA